ncbi:MAG: type VI secretion system baseplate subunit TssG [Paludibacteraceae bacterium]
MVGNAKQILSMEKKRRKDLPLGNTLSTDYKAELLAAGLVESGTPADEVRIVRMGKRTGGKAISKIAREYSHDEFVDYLNFYVIKRDLYESLPEGLFHYNQMPEGKKGRRAVLDAMKRGKQESFNARFFFRPFEMMMDRMLIVAHLYEWRLEKRDKHGEFVRLLDSHWPFLKDMELDKALFVVHFLSQSYRLTTPDQIAEVLSVCLDCEVSISLCQEQLTIREEEMWSLGYGRLGMSATMGGGVTDSFPVVKVDITGLNRAYKDLFLPDSLAYKQLLCIIDLFLPADAELQVHINAAQDAAGFLLFEGDGIVPILGFTTVLS